MAPHVDSKLTVPNVMTVFRIAMAIIAAACFTVEIAEKTAVVLCVVAALLDVFDGWYARAFAQCTRLGKHLDPLADKLLMAVVFGVLAVKIDDPVVWGLIALVAFREFAMTIFRAYSLRRYHQFIPANRLGKFKMVLQSVLGLAGIAYAYFWKGGFTFPNFVVVPALVAILCVSYFSAVVYIRTWTIHQRSRIAAPGTAAEQGRMVVGK